MTQRPRLAQRALRAVIASGLFVITGAAAAYSQSPEVGVETRRYIDAQGGLTLERLVAIALEQAPSIAASRALVAVARAEVVQARLRPNPILSTEWQEDVDGTDNRASVGVEWPLDLFRRTGRIHAAERAVDVAEQSAVDDRRLLASAVRERTGALLAAARQLDVVTDLMVAARETYALLKKRVEAGGSPPLDADLAFVEWKRVEALRHRLRAQADAALVQLKAIVGIDPATSLTLRDGLEHLVVLEQETPGLEADNTNVGKLLEQRPDVRKAEAVVSAADARADLARRTGKFDVNLFGSYARADIGFPQLGLTPTGDVSRIRDVFHNVSVGAMIVLPWRDRHQGTVAAAEAERRVAEHQRAARLLDARAEIDAARAREVQARQSLEVYRSGIRETARRNLDVIRESYELGRLTLFDVFAEQRRYLEVEMAYTDVLTAAFDARTVLMRALGVTP